MSATSPKEQPEGSSSGSARDLALKRILVPTDFSDSAAHARTGLAHIFLGSTAERVISHAPCPVMVVKRGEENLTQRRKGEKNVIGDW